MLLAKSHNLAPLRRRSVRGDPATGGLYATGPPPTWRTEPAALLFAGYVRSSRTALGLLAAVVQQRLTHAPTGCRGARADASPATLQALQATLEDDRRRVALGRRARPCPHVPDGHGLPLPDRQTRRRDASGRLRYTDAEWRFPTGGVVILEVDGGFHMEVEHWEDDIVRERDLVATGAVVLRCTDRELRDEPTPGRLAARVGVGRSSA